MNKQRRKEIEKIYGIIEDMYNALEALKDEEEEYRDNIPENMQGGERYEIAASAISNMEDALEHMNEVMYCLEEAAQ
mgnify:CR=1 FL=1